MLRTEEEELVSLIREALASNDPETAHEINSIIKAVCQKGHADRKEVWARLTASEQLQFTTLLRS